MNLAKKLMRIVLLMCSIFSVQQAHAGDQQDINQLIQNLYGEHIKVLLCIKQGEDSGIDKQLLAVSAKYLSLDFLKYYQSVCYGATSLPTMDFRTGELDSFDYIDSNAKFTNLNIEQPKVKGNHARIRTTYDLPVDRYKEYGNFTVFSLIKENGQWKIDDIELGGHDLNKDNEREDRTGLQVIKSLKRFIKRV